jgi:uncharacterized protein YfeS
LSIKNSSFLDDGILLQSTKKIITKAVAHLQIILLGKLFKKLEFLNKSAIIFTVSPN